MNILETKRLRLRRLNLDDAPFILQIVNEPSWLQFIGDKGVKTLADARQYLQTGPLMMFSSFGFGTFLVELRTSSAAIGLCGLIKRDGLTDIDLGFAFLPAYWGQGYAHEAAAATISYGKQMHDLSRIVAITACENHASIKLLQKLGFQFARMVRLNQEDEVIKLFAIVT